MKYRNLVWSAVLLFSCVALASAQTITLVMPNNGGNYVKGSNMAVVWKYKNIPDTATVRLVLFQNGLKQAFIKSIEKINDPMILKDKDGYSFGGLKGQWKVGECEGGFSAGPGCNYTIRVVVNNSGENDYSDQPFCITDPSQSVFKLNSPKGGEKWETGSTQKISWTSINQYSPQVLIKLWKGDVEWGAIIPVGAVKASVQASAGAIDWKVGDNPKNHEYVTAPDYRISIEPVTRVAGGPSIVKSGAFTITVPEFVRIDPNIRNLIGDKWIKVNEPAAGATLTRMQQYRVKWTCSDNLKKTYARLELWQNNHLIKTYAAKFPLSISGHDLQLTTEIPVGDYTIRIQSLADPAVIGDSGVFHVLAKVSFSQISYPAETKNLAKWINRTYKGISNFFAGGEFTIADPNKPDGWYDPGPGNIRVGFKNECKGGNGTCYAYRSWIFFDLQGLEDVEVIKAIFSFSEAPGVPTPMYLHRRTTSWNGTYQSLFDNAGLIAVNPGDLKAVVQEWMKNPAQNYGLVMTGNNENFACNNAGAIHMLSNVKLIVDEKNVE